MTISRGRHRELERIRLAAELEAAELGMAIEAAAELLGMCDQLTNRQVVAELGFDVESEPELLRMTPAAVLRRAVARHRRAQDKA